MFERKLELPKEKTETFFLWGPRQTGKTTLLRQKYPNAFWIDLLKADHYRRYLTRPERMREEIEALESTPFVVIDEAHRLRNVYKSGNKTERALRTALASVPKVLPSKISRT